VEGKNFPTHERMLEKFVATHALMWGRAENTFTGSNEVAFAMDRRGVRKKKSFKKRERSAVIDLGEGWRSFSLEGQLGRSSGWKWKAAKGNCRVKKGARGKLILKKKGILFVKMWKRPGTIRTVIVVHGQGKRTGNAPFSFRGEGTVCGENWRRDPSLI